MADPLKKSRRTCPKGHQYYKSSDCPICPVCEQLRKPENGFLARLAAPARRALGALGISELEQLCAFSENQISSLHGIGPSALKTLKSAMRDQALNFKDF